MKKTNGRSRTNPHNSGTKPKLTREAPRKETNNIVNQQAQTWHDAQPSMMHVGLNMHDMAKCNRQYYKLSGAQYATSCILTKHHNNYLVLSRLGTHQY